MKEGHARKYSVGSAMKSSRRDASCGVLEMDGGYGPDGETLGSDEERRIGHAVVIAHEPR